MTTGWAMFIGFAVSLPVYCIVQQMRFRQRVKHTEDRVQWVEGELRKMQRPQLTLIRGGKK